MCTLLFLEARKGAKSPGTGVTDVCELPCGFWKLNPGPLKEQTEILIHSEPPPLTLRSSKEIQEEHSGSSLVLLCLGRNRDLKTKVLGLSESPFAPLGLD